MEEDFPILFGGDFPILFSAACDMSVIHRFQPKDMDALGQEISRAFQRCAVPESQLSTFDLEQTQAMMMTVFMFDRELLERSKMSSREGALRMLFLKTIVTPMNLQALCSMCDPITRTGVVRCQAIIFLYHFMEFPSIWSMQVPLSSSDGSGMEKKKENTTSCSFGRKLIPVMVNVLLGQSNRFCFTSGKCPCGDLAWVCVSMALEHLIASEPVAGMLELLASYDWALILQSKDACVTSTPVFYDAMIFIGLHRWACPLLIVDQDNNYNRNSNNATATEAKTFLRENLGSCHELFRKVLRRIITGEIHSPIIRIGQSRLDEVEPIFMFLERYFSCLAPVPVDRETKSLVRRARIALAEIFDDSFPPIQHSPRSQRIEHILYTMDNYQRLNNESDQFRWDLLYERFLSPRMVTSQNKIMKTVRKAWRKEVKVQNNLGDGEMCSNCFVLEKTLLDESNQAEGLMKCQRCRQMKYCSRSCQVEHWKKAHKKHCKTVVVDDKAASSAKKSEKS